MRVMGAVKDYKHFERMVTSYKPFNVNLNKMKWVGEVPLLKSGEKMKLITPPVSMKMMLDLLDKDAYHYACVDAISEACFVKFECKNKDVNNFINNIQLPEQDDVISIFSDFIHYYIATGNGFLLKMRNMTGQWVGLNRLIPNEVQIVENIDSYGFLRPDYIQVAGGKKAFFKGKDIVHMLQRTSMSNAWGMACKSIILCIETLHEINAYDYNRFKNGLLLDYFIIIEGGNFGQKYKDDNGNDVDPFVELELLLQKAKGNNNSHRTILIESSDPGSKVRLEPMRVDDNNFESLKKDLRESVVIYHRVPKRLIGLQTPGQLGGDNNSDMVIFYNMVVKPIQERVAFILSKEFKKEFGWDVNPKDFSFGDISEVMDSFENKLLRDAI